MTLFEPRRNNLLSTVLQTIVTFLMDYIDDEEGDNVGNNGYVNYLHFNLLSALDLLI